MSLIKTDEQKGLHFLRALFPDSYFRPSNRGQNGFVKVRYHSIEKFNSVADRLEAALRRNFLHEGILSDIEVKGTITNGKSGRLAKLPFTSKYPYQMRDKTDSWNYAQLERFKTSKILSTRHLERIIDFLEGRIDEDAVARIHEIKDTLKGTEGTSFPPKGTEGTVLVQREWDKLPCSLR